MIALDASVLIAALRSRDAHHADATRILGVDHAFVVHTVTLAEVLVGGVRVDRVEDLQRTIGQLGVVEIDRVEHEALHLASLRATTALTMPDCCVLLTAQSRGVSLATFDARLAGAARDRGVQVLGLSA